MEKEKDIKEEQPDEMEYTQYEPRPISPNHPDLQTDNIPEPEHFETANAETSADGKDQPSSGNAEMKPWFPSAKGRSIVWDHIKWVPDTQRAQCRYCTADFQIKGGTSALLRHLKAMHPAAINFDPENPPPVVRRKAKKKSDESDYTMINAETKTYMDNLLENFLQDENMPRTDDSSTSVIPRQSRADSEIDEVIRNLQKENAQTGVPQEPETDIRALLGIQEDDPIHEELVVAGMSTEQEPTAPDEEKQVSSSSGQNARKRRNEDGRVSESSGGQMPEFKQRKVLPTYPPNARRTLPTTPAPVIAAYSVPTSSSAQPPKFGSDTVHILDFEAKMLYNQSLRAHIKKEESEALYYRLMARKAELEIKKLERELGEESRATSSDEPEPEQEQEQEQEHEQDHEE